MQLPDRTLLQGTFGPLEAGAAIHAWVASCLADAAARPFRLFTTPPPQPLVPDESRLLHELWRAAAVLVYCAWIPLPGFDKKAVVDAESAFGGADFLSPALLASAVATASAVALAPPAMPLGVRIAGPLEMVDDAAVEAAAAALLGGGVAGAKQNAPKSAAGSSFVPAAFSNLFKKK